MLSEIGDDRRDIMATTIQQIHPVAHVPLVLGVLRRLEVATMIDRLAQFIGDCSSPKISIVS